MRVGFLSHSGASVYHFRMPIIKALEARNDEVLLILPKDEYALKLEKMGFKVVFYELKRSSINPFVVFLNFLSLLKLLKKLKLDLIQSAAHKSNTFGLIAAKFAKIPYKLALVEGLGSFYIDNDLKTRLVRLNIELLYKISFTIADKFIFVNESNAHFMQNLGLKEEKIIIIKSVGINLRQFFPMIANKEQKEHFFKEHKLNPHKPLVIMVARALWHKGIKEFYEAALNLNNFANFILVGGRDENKSCADLKFLNEGKVRYLSAREDIAFLLNLSDIFVLPSYKEGFPVSVLEAKACKKAVVVSDCEGCVEAVRNGVDGLWAKTADSKDLSEKIKLLLDDERLRVNLANNAYKDALNYDENLIAARYLKLYDNLIKS
ncbi:N,N'-diacetylbacillosaminyl-diphospho-undecaprenol alpha-1,3-N-acetylgalactosaminyltransferase [Campylobacter sp. MIT 12-5580]|uniref:N, N'-diacetylbacillosaminyl-diphospho-undecaprenol alpha-1,3-N-acetylgalactosaminyltransferase n=1 Tax=Campylobacter sp. MIT 12-5580 TaxID=2040651 RepID=UPI0010F62C62|nr:N,N'-diacetylbacillosaminyl-diphospho-undecaprenol alpha-1,3-N-acetylgalactosaminyltransferase [Campylobacter sp. MIT 12-5580]TKX30365.1 N,N'-diacetylbacillosaminyl-diphospho-undecaprenol alpha-1,3-N-acetylgalactosaminyltransferase [Campylobacter sp. MIT 12-5580]